MTALMVVCGQAYLAWRFFWNYLLPVIVFAYCYGRIFDKVRRQNKIHGRGSIPRVSRGQSIGNQNHHHQQQQQRQPAGTTGGGKLSQTELNIIKTMMYVIVCFLVCWSGPSFVRFIRLIEVCML